MEAIEIGAMDWLLRGEDPILAVLRRQFAHVTLRSRKMTGVGFYLNFNVPHDVARLRDEFPVKPDFQFGDVEAQVDSLKSGIGFLLWIAEGRLDCLEAYTYDERWPSEITAIRFGYFGGRRDLKELRQQWELH